MKDKERELEFEVEAEDTPPEEVLKKMRAKLKQCQSEKQEYLETSQRLRADYINLKRNSEQERIQTIKFANENLLLELIDLMDNLDQATAWFPGTEQIASKFVAILKQNGVEIIDPLRQTFNPSESQAIATVDTNKEEEDNIVLEVSQKGYRLNGRVVRPASVKVGHKV
ncbi:nucleotide exchange factor GrpE [Candidatus Nomurabacteria bacterium]|nr:nucleotide exchange factor GrpE [Candidatus Nomurabacteria bacterium]